MKKANKIQSANNNLRPNPFTAYRDSHTGRWVVIKSEEVKAKGNGELVLAAA